MWNTESRMTSFSFLKQYLLFGCFLYGAFCGLSSTSLACWELLRSCSRNERWCSKLGLHSCCHSEQYRITSCLRLYRRRLSCHASWKQSTRWRTLPNDILKILFSKRRKKTIQGRASHSWAQAWGTSLLSFKSQRVRWLWTTGTYSKGHRAKWTIWR